MSKGSGHGHGVSGYTHTQAKLDDYAYQANLDNHADQCNPNNEKYAGHDHDK